MRTRLVIPAAVLFAAAYVKGRKDALAERIAPSRRCELPEDVRRRAEAEAADAMELAGEQVVARADAELAVTAAPIRDEGARAGRGAPSDSAQWAVPEFRPPTGPPQERAADPDPHPGPDPEPEPDPEPDPEPEPEPDPEPEPEPVAQAPSRDAAPESPPEEDPDMTTLAEWSATLAPHATPSASSPESATLAPHATPSASSPEPLPPAVLSEWSGHVSPAASAPAEPAPAEPTPAEPTPAELAPPSVEVVIEESGRFSLGGWAAQPGHMALCGVTFRDRRDRKVDPGAIRLFPEALANVAEGGVVVLGDPGFAPDSEGFTLLVASAGPGSFAAAGRYEVVGG